MNMAQPLQINVFINNIKADVLNFLVKRTETKVYICNDDCIKYVCKKLLIGKNSGK